VDPTPKTLHGTSKVTQSEIHDTPLILTEGGKENPCNFKRKYIFDVTSGIR
jgi:hypothetical protein